jgi:hypothetical protein
MIFDKLQTADSIRFRYEKSISPPGRDIIPDQTRASRRSEETPSRKRRRLIGAGYSSRGRHGSSIETANHPGAFQSEA